MHKQCQGSLYFIYLKTRIASVCCLNTTKIYCTAYINKVPKWIHVLHKDDWIYCTVNTVLFKM